MAIKKNKVVAKKKALKKTAKKATPKKVAKKAVPKKAAVSNLNTWKVVCSKDGVIASGLSITAAQNQATSHQAATGHKTTYTNTQNG